MYHFRKTVSEAFAYKSVFHVLFLCKIVRSESCSKHIVYADRDLNVGFSGGEKKKAEILQMLLLQPRLAILDETDSGLDVDAVRTVSQGVEAYQESRNGALLIITHSTRILESLHVDHVHILVRGRIVRTGDASLIEEINRDGFEKFIQDGDR